MQSLYSKARIIQKRDEKRIRKTIPKTGMVLESTCKCFTVAIGPASSDPLKTQNAKESYAFSQNSLNNRLKTQHFLPDSP